MKNFSFILIILIISSCNTKTTEIKYYPTDAIGPNQNILKINLDSTKLNFKGITDLVGKVDSENKKLVIEINDNEITKNIIPYVYKGGLIKERNVLTIKSDSIFKDYGYGITDLKIILKKHYTNNGKNYTYSDSPEKAIVIIAIDTSKTGIELKNMLINLTRTFDEIQNEVKDTLELRILFDSFSQMAPPPKPPKPL